jgi:hypothetical protein
MATGRPLAKLVLTDEERETLVAASKYVAGSGPAVSDHTVLCRRTKRGQDSFS